MDRIINENELSFYIFIAFLTRPQWMAAERKLITNLHKMYIFCTPFISENILREGPMKEPFDFEFNGLNDHLLGLYLFLYELLSTLKSGLDLEGLKNQDNMQPLQTPIKKTFQICNNN